MTQFNLDAPIVASTKSGTQLASDLSNWRDAVHSAHKGSTQPSYRVAGMRWVDDTTSTMHIVKIYDGAQWAIEGYLDTTNDLFFPATQNPRYNFPNTAGTQPTYTLTLAPALTAYVDQAVFTVEIHSTNSGAATLNVNAIGAKKVMKIVAGTPTALAGSELQAGVRYFLSYDAAADSAAGAFILVGASPDLPSLTGVITDSQLPGRLQTAGVVFPGSFNNASFETGLYRTSTANQAWAPNTTDAFYLKVLRWSSVYQFQEAVAVGSPTLVYQRWLDNGTWSAWTRSYNTSAEVQSLVDNALVALGYGAVATYAELYRSSTAYGEGINVAGSALVPAGGVAGNGTISSDGFEQGGFTKGGGAEAGSWNARHRNNFSGTWARVGIYFRYA